YLLRHGPARDLHCLPVTDSHVDDPRFPDRDGFLRNLPRHVRPLHVGVVPDAPRRLRVPDLVVHPRRREVRRLPGADPPLGQRAPAAPAAQARRPAGRRFLTPAAALPFFARSYTPPPRRCVRIASPPPPVCPGRRPSFTL